MYALAGSSARATGQFGSLGDMSEQERTIREDYIRIFRRLVRPCFEFQTAVKRGDVLGAISRNLTGIQYANTYAVALLTLGDREVPFQGKMVSASALHKWFCEQDFFYAPMGPSEFWEVMKDKSAVCGKHPRILQMKKGVFPADAFKSFESHLCFIDCNAILEVAVNLLLIELYGDKLFNKYAKKFNLTRIGEGPKEIYKEIPSRVHRSLDEPFDELTIGEGYYMFNHVTYTDKHKHGSDAGINLKFLGNNREGRALFTGLGLDPFGVTLREVADILRASYNETPLSARALVRPELAQKFETSFSVDGPVGKSTILLKDVPEYASGTKRHPHIARRVFQDQILPYVRVTIEKEERIHSRQLTRREFENRTDLLPGKGFACLDLDIPKILEIFENLARTPESRCSIS